jgi:predicted small secreted protein
MRKRTILVTLAVLLFALPSLAGNFTTGGPSTTNNDDSCDISLLPAATLLLPYFEVSLGSNNGETTLFTVTNTTNRPQIARVTLWTDYSFPVLDFNIYLTGYDVQSINLYDVIVRGVIAPDSGTGQDISPEGELSENQNPLIDTANCDQLPGAIPAVYVNRMKRAFTEGVVTQIGPLAGCNTVGGVHQNAVGYATIDVAATCGFRLPTESAYYQEELLWDNVFTGDFQQVNGSLNYAQGNPLVHIRAVPEGDSAVNRREVPISHAVNLPATFYSQFQNGAKFDARQPLPSRFAARWIKGGPSEFQTFYKIWRQSNTTGATACAEYGHNSILDVTEITMFDEEENPTTVSQPICCINSHIQLPSTSLTPVSDSSVFPQNSDGAVAGWMYFNLDDATGDHQANQAWIVTSMRASGRFSTDTDATALGNGCSPEVGESEAYGTTTEIGPSPNLN